MGGGGGGGGGGGEEMRKTHQTEWNRLGGGGESCDKLTKRSGTGVELFQQSSLCAACRGVFCDFQVEEGHAIQHLMFTTGQRTQHVKTNSYHHLPQAEERNAVHGIKLTMVIQTQKGSKEHLFISTWTHSMHIFGEVPFIKPPNDT